VLLGAGGSTHGCLVRPSCCSAYCVREEVNNREEGEEKRENRKQEGKEKTEKEKMGKISNLEISEKIKDNL
jgi:hypothetical protein